MKYIISDIHGQVNELEDLIDYISIDADEYIFLGDYVDRGYNPKEVIDLLIDLNKNNHCIFLKGNHEDMWMQYLNGDKNMIDMILNYGGVETVKSYVDKNISYDDIKVIMNDDNRIREALGIHKEFYDKLVLYYELDKFLCIHGGINPLYKDVPLSIQKPHDLMWIKEDFINSKFLYQNKKIIFGHTSFQEPYVDEYKIGINTGMGSINAFCVELGYIINNKGRILK